MAYVIGCDVGTSGTKAIVVSENGKVLSKVTVEYPLSTPHPGWAEQHPDTWYAAALKAIAGAVKKARVASQDVKALGSWARCTPRFSSTRTVKFSARPALVRHAHP